MNAQTEMFVKVRVRDKAVLDILQYMCNWPLSSKLPLPCTPNHPLFQTEGWRTMFSPSPVNGYAGAVPKVLKEWVWDEQEKSWWVVGLTTFRSYEDEVVLFFDWIRPYALNKGLIGWANEGIWDIPLMYLNT